MKQIILAKNKDNFKELIHDEVELYGKSLAHCLGDPLICKNKSRKVKV